MCQSVRTAVLNSRTAARTFGAVVTLYVSDSRTNPDSIMFSLLRLSSQVPSDTLVIDTLRVCLCANQYVC